MSCGGGCGCGCGACDRCECARENPPADTRRKREKWLEIAREWWAWQDAHGSSGSAQLEAFAAEEGVNPWQLDRWSRWWLNKLGERAARRELGRTIYLVGCGAKKASSASEARDLYTGDLFTKSRAFVEQQGAAPGVVGEDSAGPTWFVLSAKHGLLSPTEITDPYDQKMPTKAIDRVEWADEVRRDLEPGPGDRFILIAGQSYRRELVPLLEGVGAAVEVPLAGLGIGQQKKRLLELTRDGPSASARSAGAGVWTTPDQAAESSRRKAEAATERRRAGARKAAETIKARFRDLGPRLSEAGEAHLMQTLARKSARRARKERRRPDIPIGTQLGFKFNPGGMMRKGKRNESVGAALERLAGEISEFQGVRYYLAGDAPLAGRARDPGAFQVLFRVDHAALARQLGNEFHDEVFWSGEHPPYQVSYMAPAGGEGALLTSLIVDEATSFGETKAVDVVWLWDIVLQRQIEPSELAAALKFRDLFSVRAQRRWGDPSEKWIARSDQIEGDPRSNPRRAQFDLFGAPATGPPSSPSSPSSSLLREADDYRDGVLIRDSKRRGSTREHLAVFVAETSLDVDHREPIVDQLAAELLADPTFYPGATADPTDPVYGRIRRANPDKARSSSSAPVRRARRARNPPTRTIRQIRTPAGKADLPVQWYAVPGNDAIRVHHVVKPTKGKAVQTGKGWQLTHRLSGARLGAKTYPTKKGALAAAKRGSSKVSGVPWRWFDWGIVDPESRKQIQRWIAAAEGGR